MTTDSVEHESTADRIVGVVTAHPCVVRMDAGEFGVVATHLPGRKVIGVRDSDGDSDGVIEICVVLRMRRPVPEVVAELRERVRAITGDVPVDVTVADVLSSSEQPRDETDL